MNFLYNIIVNITYLLIKIVALFNQKLKLFVNGRKETFHKLSVLEKDDKVVWFHAASLGEFEQGRPIIERVKKQYPKHKIVVTFFSPSGYGIRKNYKLADVICYLPVDTKANMKRFINQVHPELAIIVKYEFWPNLLSVLKKQNIKTILVSGIFRKKQSFFKFYGGWMRKKLKAFDHFFVQNKSSESLLNEIQFSNVKISGDTRFDRVSEILPQDNTLNFIEDFKNNTYTIVAGSTWASDEKLLIDYINNKASNYEKFIIAPHNINPKEIEKLRTSILKKSILFSEKDNVNLKEYQVFIIDTIGLLTKIYAYADAAYVGGGLKTGLHNILEPATFGIPIVFGGDVLYKKFQEAVDLLKSKGSVNVINQEELSSIFTQLKEDKELRINMGKINKQYVKNNTGATDLIMNYISKNLK